jgi:hypothetical protein
MKHLLLLLCLTSLTFSAHAQFANLVGIGAVAGINALKGRTQQTDVYVSQATYRAQAFPQKRTPPKKLPKADGGGTEITAIEQLLSTRYTALQADSTSVLLNIDQEKEFSRLRNNLQAFNPSWSADAYLAELDFYRQQDMLRKRRTALGTK